MTLSPIIREFLGRRDYYSKDEIIQFVKNSKYYDSNLEDLSKATALLFFQTSKQQTWLVSTSKRLYCILDDNRKDKLHLNWSISKQDIFNSDINTRDYSDDIGLIDIGPEKNWLYSKKLFKDVDIKTSVVKEIFSLILRTTSFLRKEKQKEFQEKIKKGRIYYDIRAMVDSDVEGSLEKIDKVEYHLHPTFPNPIRENYDHENKFLLKELAYGEFELIAKVFLKDRVEVIELRHWIKLQETGPYFIKGYIIQPGSNLIGSNLEGAILRNANLEAANLERANLNNTDLSGANLNKAKLRWAELTKANLKHANLRSVVADNAKLNEATLIKANLNNAQLSKADLTDANLNNAKLLRAKLFGAIFKNTKLRNTELDKADLRSVNLSGADLSNASLILANMKGIKEMKDANLRGCKMKNAFFDEETNFKGVIFDLVFLDSLQGSDWSKAQWDQDVLKEIENRHGNN